MVDGLLKTKIFLSINITILRDLILLPIFILLLANQRISRLEKLTLTFASITILLLDYFIIISNNKNKFLMFYGYFPIYHFEFVGLFMGSYLAVKEQLWTFSKKFKTFVFFPIWLAFCVWFMVEIFKISYFIFLSSLITLILFTIEIFLEKKILELNDKGRL